MQGRFCWAGEEGDVQPNKRTNAIRNRSIRFYWCRPCSGLQVPVRGRENAPHRLFLSNVLLDMWSRDQHQNVRTATPITDAISSALWGLPFVGGGLMMVASLLSGDPSGNSGTFLMSLLGALMFLGFGGWMWRKAYKAFTQWRVFGTSHLQMESEPVPLGASLRARLRAPIPAGNQPPDGFQVRVVATEESRIGSSSHEQLVWEDWSRVRGQPGAGETEVPLSLDLPARPLRSSAKDTLESLDWTLEVTASLDDKLDYEVSFDLPVSVPDDLGDRAADDPSSGGSVSSRGLSGPDEEPVAVDAEEAFSEPVSEGVHMQESSGEGITFLFEHARPNVKTSGLNMAGMGPFLIGLGGAALYGALSGGISLSIGLLFGVPFTLAGGFFLRTAWTMLTHTTTVRVAGGEVEVQKGPFFLDPTPVQFPCHALDDTQIEAAMHVGTHSFYSLSLVTDGADSKDEIPVTGTLANKEEADWIADRIRQAAQWT